MTHPVGTIKNFQRFAESAMTDAAIGEQIGVARRTVNKWRHGGVPSRTRRSAEVAASWEPPAARTYAYVLGMYLGDGYVARAASHPFLQVTLDSRYPGVIAECQAALAQTFPASKVHLYERRGSAGRVLQVSSVFLRIAFPQHGPGKKHQRLIELAGWQREITERYPERFLRGLIHSDGSRCLNRFSMRMKDGSRKPYAYPRYFFTNYSADIRQIFCDHCDLIGIRWTQSNPRNISISHRDSVAILDSFVGPKR